MKKAFILILCSAPVFAQLREAGTVTFVAGPTLYASIGRNNGIGDSATAIIRSGSDTLAVLRLMAVSSRSSSWTIVRTSRDINVGDTIVVMTPVRLPAKTALPPDTRPSALTPPDSNRRQTGDADPSGLLAVHGRLSLQYHAVRFDTESASLNQPALAVSLNAALKEMPVRVSLYGVHRRQTRGSLSPFDRSSRPDSRIYRLSADYDDGTTLVSAGRIHPSNAIPAGMLDGVSVARRFGGLLAGLAGGIEPNLALNIRQQPVWKGMAFLAFQAVEPVVWGTGLGYTRSYIRRSLAREQVFASGYFSLSSGIMFNGYLDLDLRVPLADRSTANPSLTSVTLFGSWHVNRWVTVHGGVDGVRAVPSARDYGVLPDTLFNRSMRSGVSGGATIWISQWMWSMNVSPRLGPEAAGREYSANTSLGTSNILSSGVEIRATVNTNASAFTRYSSYGFQVRRIMWGADLRIRSQYNESTVLQRNEGRTGTLLGGDLVLSLSRTVSLMGAVDFWRGTGFHMDVVFLELSWRF